MDSNDDGDHSYEKPSMEKPKMEQTNPVFVALIAGTSARGIYGILQINTLDQKMYRE